MTPELIQNLRNLADKYETTSFCDADPSQFLRWYPFSRTADVECASFIAAMLAFGNRKQFIPKIREILQMADSVSGGVAAWCLAGAPGFPHGEKKFYRFYSYDDMHCLFSELAQILSSAGTLGQFFQNKVGASHSLQSPQSLPDSALPVFSATPFSGLKEVAFATIRKSPQRPLTLAEQISAAFPKSAIVPKGAGSANKRIHMFLRWMVRQNSPVDLGLWRWANPAELLIPLDVHVMQEAIGLGLLPSTAKATARTARELTSILSEAFPGDPSRADFALFGLGVDKEK